MSYLSTTDFADDPAFVDRFQRNMKGDLDLSWMKVERERGEFGPPRTECSAEQPWCIRSDGSKVTMLPAAPLRDCIVVAVREVAAHRYRRTQERWFPRQRELEAEHEVLDDP